MDHRVPIPFDKLICDFQKQLEFQRHLQLGNLDLGSLLGQGLVWLPVVSLSPEFLVQDVQGLIHSFALDGGLNLAVRLQVALGQKFTLYSIVVLVVGKTREVGKADVVV